MQRYFLFLAKILVTVTAALGFAAAQSPDLRRLYEMRRPAPPAPAAGRSSRLDPALAGMLQESAASAPVFVEPRGKGPGNPAGSTRVAIRVHVEGTVFVSPLRAKISILNGEVTSVDGRGVISARVPIESLEALSTTRGVALVSLQPTVSPLAAPADVVEKLSTFVRSTGAEMLHARGVNGFGVKIGVIDVGFAGYEQLQRRNLVPPSPPDHDGFFNDDRAMSDSPLSPSWRVHGTVVAEILHAMAPEAELYRAIIGNRLGEADADQFQDALEWLAGKAVDIIVFAGGGHAGPSDDRDPFAAAVNRVVKRYPGVLFVAANGNEAQGHWMGTLSGRNRHWLEIGGPERYFFFLKQSAQSSRLSVLVKWDDWPWRFGSKDDLDVLIYEVDQSTMQVKDVGSGRTTPRLLSQDPVERFTIEAKPGAMYALGLWAERISHRMKVHIYVEGAEMYPFVPEGSVRSPALASGAFAVGAIGDKSNLNALYGRSSWGPSDDGRLKPDVVAPAYAESALGEFAGTSVAAAFAGGFAALVRQIEPAAAGRTLGERVRLATARLGNDSPNYQFGFGAIRADSLSHGHPVPGAPNKSVSVPPEWGGTVGEAALDAALRRGLAAADGSDVRVITGSDIYHRGDGMRVGLSSSADRSCLLVMRGSTGRYRPLSAGWPNIALKLGAERVLPEDGVLTVADLPGLYDLIALCAERPFPLAPGRIDGQTVSAAMYRFEVR